MTKCEKLTDIILNYQLVHEDYTWYSEHKYVFSALIVRDYSVLSPYTQTQITAIKRIYTTWIHAMELASKIDDELKYNRCKRGY